jgi:hypothetical protein
MRRFLLTAPLLLVFGLLFVQLPNTNSGSSNTSISTQINSPVTAATSQLSQTFATQSVTKSKSPVTKASKTQLPGKKIKVREEGNENENEGEYD